MHSRRSSRATAFAAGLLLTCAACSVDRNHRLLSFFFDGVPDPNAPTLEPEPPVQAVSAVEFAATPSEERGSSHAPVRDRLCHECHQTPERTAGAGWQAGLPELVVPREELCRRCHAAPTDAVVHGPAGAQRCDLCHESHQSSFPHLLRFERQEALCLSCHQGELFLTAVQHEAYTPGDCIDCHDPHGSEAPFLLRPDREPEPAVSEAAR